MARCFVDVYHLGRIPRTIIGYSQDNKTLRTLPDYLVGRPEVKIANIALTFMLIVAGFTIFRAPSLETIGG